jgi:hypothetical protein
VIEREFLVATLRCAKLRVALLGAELDTIGIALRRDLMTPEAAIGALDDLDAWPFLLPEIKRETSER